MIGPEDLEDSPPPSDEVEEAEKVEVIGEVVEIGEVEEVEEEVKEAEVVTEVEAKGDTEEPTNVEEVVQVLFSSHSLICTMCTFNLLLSRWNSHPPKLRRSRRLPQLLRTMTLRLSSWSPPLHLLPLQLNLNLCQLLHLHL